MVGTLLPSPYFTALDASGNPVSGARLYFFDSGTSTPATVYTDAALTTPHASPVVCDSSGRCVVYLPAGSFKVQVKTAGDVLVRETDPVTAVAPYNVDLDIPGVAGESLAVGDVVYLSGGDGGTTAGRWYQTDADDQYKSSLASMVGIVPRAISTGATGTIRLSGRLDGLAGLTAGTPYYVSTTAGALTATPPTNARLVGVADATTSIVLFGGNGGGITVTSGLSFVPLEAYGSDQAAVIATINASAEGGGTLKIAANKIQIDGTTTFASGYNPTAKLNTDGSNATAGFLTAIGAADASDTALALASKIAEGDFDNSFFAAHVTSIDGGIIATNTLAANRILAGEVTGWTFNANTLTGNTITGGTVQTASANARVEMSGSANALTLYNSAGSQIGRLDGTGVVLGPASGAYNTYDNQYAYRFSVGGSDDGEVFGLYGSYVANASKFLGLRNTWDGAASSDSGEAVTFIEAVSTVYPGGTTYTSSIQLHSGSGAHGITYTAPDGHEFSGGVSVAGNLLPDASANNRHLGSAAATFQNIHLNLSGNQSPSYIVVNNASDATSLGYLTGHNGDVTISGTVLRFRCGVVIAVNP